MSTSVLDARALSLGHLPPSYDPVGRECCSAITPPRGAAVDRTEADQPNGVCADQRFFRCFGKKEGVTRATSMIRQSRDSARTMAQVVGRLLDRRPTFLFQT